MPSSFSIISALSTALFTNFMYLRLTTHTHANVGGITYFSSSVSFCSASALYSASEEAYNWRRRATPFLYRSISFTRLHLLTQSRKRGSSVIAMRSQKLR